MLLFLMLRAFNLSSNGKKSGTFLVKMAICVQAPIAPMHHHDPSIPPQMASLIAGIYL